MTKLKIVLGILWENCHRAPSTNRAFEQPKFLDNFLIWFLQILQKEVDPSFYHIGY
jgi:hypothetical protein